MSHMMSKVENQLYDALKQFAALEVKGHSLADRLQFSDEGRALLAKIEAALKLYEDEAKRLEIQDKCESNFKLYGG